MYTNKELQLFVDAYNNLSRKYDLATVSIAEVKKWFKVSGVLKLVTSLNYEDLPIYIDNTDFLRKYISFYNKIILKWFNDCINIRLKIGK